MIATVQRVKKSNVSVEKKIIADIKIGLNIFLGIMKNDDKSDAEYLAKKISTLRIFNDKNFNINLSIKDVKGSLLVISQFTLCADLKNGNRPSFTKAAEPCRAKKLYKYFINELKKFDLEVQSGKFGSIMNVSILNDGPATFILDSENVWNVKYVLLWQNLV